MDPRGTMRAVIVFAIFAFAAFATSTSAQEDFEVLPEQQDARGTHTRRMKKHMEAISTKHAESTINDFNASPTESFEEPEELATLSVQYRHGQYRRRQSHRHGGHHSGHSGGNGGVGHVQIQQHQSESICNSLSGVYQLESLPCYCKDRVIQHDNVNVHLKAGKCQQYQGMRAGVWKSFCKPETMCCNHCNTL